MSNMMLDLNANSIDSRQPQPMQWSKLLSSQRLSKQIDVSKTERSPFQKDVDRIIFSSAFRRLQDKTQVFPLAKNDYVRTRLTHSLEVSSVGRSLATKVGDYIIAQYRLDARVEDFGNIVSAACLSHDIGNPPFGHFGEEAIRAFFSERPIGQAICRQLSDIEKADLLNFEGNAQGFRVVSKLQNPETIGGMCLTYATLGASSKYPCTSIAISRDNIATKKNGVFYDDIAHFSEVADALSLLKTGENRWCRHPLTFLMEAADDICYGIIDIEDAHQVKEISYNEALQLLKPLAKDINEKYLTDTYSNSEKISYLRAKAIGCLVKEVVECFIENEKSILCGQFNQPLADKIPSSKELKALTEFAGNHIYNCQSVVNTEIAGYRIIGDLLEMFCQAVNDIAENSKPLAASKMVFHILPTRFIGKGRIPDENLYIRTLKICDYVSGMTDSYAVSLYQNLTGIQVK